MGLLDRLVEKVRPQSHKQASKTAIDSAADHHDANGRSISNNATGTHDGQGDVSKHKPFVQGPFTGYDSSIDPYAPLNPIRLEIRLLHILPTNDESSQIRCYMRTVSLMDMLDYDCVSYCWGDVFDTEEILLNDRPTRITRSLASAFHRFRSADTEFSWIWADALCINQEDIEERTRQVSMMKDIYCGARRVRSWLQFDGKPNSGGRTPEIMAAFNVLLNLDKYKNTAKIGGVEMPLLATPDPLIAAHDFSLLFANEYWKRVWILQEVTMTDKVRLFFGSESIDLQGTSCFGSMADRVMLWMSALDHAHAQAKNAKPPLTDLAQLTQMATVSLRKTMRQSLLTLRVGAGIYAKASGPVGSTLLQMRSRQSTVKHDYVYGMLGLLPGSIKITPDYSQPWQQVFADFTVKACAADRSLETLAYAVSDHPELPSWVADLTAETDPHAFTRFPFDLFDAAAGTAFFLPTPTANSIQVPGLLVSAVVVIGPDLPYDSYDTARDNHVLYDVLIDCILMHAKAIGKPRTREDVENNGNIDTGVLSALLRGMHINDEDDGFAPDFRISQSELAGYKEAMDHMLRLDRDRIDKLAQSVFHSATHNAHKGLFYVDDAGRPGWANKLLKTGDKICVLASSRVPFVVRPDVRDGVSGYRLVCMTYLHGIMDGEAVVGRLKHKGAIQRQGHDINALLDHIMLV